uniref:Uncharacterized protein n=1 Tax=Callorhinchus milii TaxID=7868 RepID=A0A4W3GSA7_CALMI
GGGGGGGVCRGGVREGRGWRRQHQERPGAPPHPNCPLALAVHSYWFDLWLFVLFDLVLFAIVYLL